jgi:hypothetical protein
MGPTTEVARVSLLLLLVFAQPAVRRIAAHAQAARHLEMMVTVCSPMIGL